RSSYQHATRVARASTVACPFSEAWSLPSHRNRAAAESIPGRLAPSRDSACGSGSADGGALRLARVVERKRVGDRPGVDATRDLERSTVDGGGDSQPGDRHRPIGEARVHRARDDANLLAVGVKCVTLGRRLVAFEQHPKDLEALASV